MSAPTSEEVWKHVNDVVVELLAERGEEAGPLATATRINSDLGISSVDAVHLLILLEDRLGTPLNFQELAVRDGQYVEDLALGEVHAFACKAVGVRAN